MTRRPLAVASLALCAALAACASSGPPPDTRVVDLDEMQELLGSESEPFVIRIPEGSRVPVMIEMTAPFVHSEGGDPALHAVFDRTVYWYPGTPDRISYDGTTWQAFNEGADGQLSFGLGKSEKKGVHGNVRVALTPRSSK